MTENTVKVNEVEALRAENGQLRGFVATSARLHEAALTAVARAIRVAGEDCAAHGIEYLADWMNGCDAVSEEDVPHYEAWAARGYPGTCDRFIVSVRAAEES